MRGRALPCQRLVSVKLCRKSDRAACWGRGCAHGADKSPLYPEHRDALAAPGHQPGPRPRGPLDNLGCRRALDPAPFSPSARGGSGSSGSHHLPGGSVPLRPRQEAVGAAVPAQVAPECPASFTNARLASATNKETWEFGRAVEAGSGPFQAEPGCPRPGPSAQDTAALSVPLPLTGNPSIVSVGGGHGCGRCNLIHTGRGEGEVVSIAVRVPKGHRGHQARGKHRAYGWLGWLSRERPGRECQEHSGH